MPFYHHYLLQAEIAHSPFFSGTSGEPTLRQLYSVLKCDTSLRGLTSGLCVLHASTSNLFLLSWVSLAIAAVVACAASCRWLCLPSTSLHQKRRYGS